MFQTSWRFAGALTLLLAALTGAPAQAKPLTIVALGDSLTAGYGLPEDESFPAQLEATLKAKGLEARVINAGVSGDTAAAGLARLDWAVPENADAVIVELGANDALRGLDPTETKRALDEILSRLKARGLPVLLTGMEGPRNYGPEYQEAFAAIYPNLAQKYGALLYPFFLDGIAMDAKLNQPDGLHPTKDGVGKIVGSILPKVEELIARVKAR